MVFSNGVSRCRNTIYMFMFEHGVITVITSKLLRCCDPMNVRHFSILALSKVSLFIIVHNDVAYSERWGRKTDTRCRFLLIKNFNEILVDFSLIHIVEMNIFVVEVFCKIFTNKTPMPGLEDVEIVSFRVRKGKAVFVCIF